jgi:hypothetical protein
MFVMHMISVRCKQQGNHYLIYEKNVSICASCLFTTNQHHTSLTSMFMWPTEVSTESRDTKKEAHIMKTQATGLNNPCSFFVDEDRSWCEELCRTISSI